MDTDVKQPALNQPPALISDIAEFPAEFVRCWRLFPNKGVFFPLLLAWLLLFQFLGNATFGYIDTASLMYWMKNAYWNSMNQGEDGHGLLIPPLVLILLWMRRNELLALPKRLWWPGIFAVIGALLLHVMGYLIQQPRVSIVAFFAGIYALTGLAWGPRWLRATIFPFFLFVFCVPISSWGEPITFPLRQLVVHIVTFVCNHLFGMSVLREGTQLFNAAHTYQYEVAAACSGLRSFIAVLVFTIVYAFVCFDKAWKRSVIILCGLPFAILGNVLRLMCIIVSAEVWGESTGNFVHENWFFSLLPYAPALFGLIYLGRWLGERPSKPQAAPPSAP